MRGSDGSVEEGERIVREPAAITAARNLLREYYQGKPIDSAADALAGALAADQLRGATEMIEDAEDNRLRIERLVRANARRAMVIDIIERLVEDPECEMGPSDHDYWSPLHDALQAKLRAAATSLEPRRCPRCWEPMLVPVSAKKDAEPSGEDMP